MASTHVVEKLSFSIISQILIFESVLILGLLLPFAFSKLDVGIIFQLTIIEFNPTTSTRPLQGFPKSNKDRDL